MKYYIIAGEASGDLHASNLVKALKLKDKDSVFRAWGGDLMREAGCEIVRHYKDTAIMGFITVLKNLSVIKANIEECSNDVLNWRPDVLILVDYGGFNMKIAKFAKMHDIKVFYYISPKIWAWNTGRVKNIKKYVDNMLAIFPFEVDFYKKYGYDNVFYAGNPLVDAIQSRDFKNETFNEFITANNLKNQKIIALLAGSRSQELKYVLPEMLKVMDRFKDYQFVIAGAPSMTDRDYAPYIKTYNVKIVYGQTYRLLQQSTAALVTSGTATLETALLKIPQVVCYSGEGGAFYYFMFKTFVKVKYISLVNLIMNRELIPELLMHKLKTKNIVRHLDRILNNPATREEMLRGYDELESKVGKAGVSERFASKIISLLSVSNSSRGCV